MAYYKICSILLLFINLSVQSPELIRFLTPDVPQPPDILLLIDEPRAALYYTGRSQETFKKAKLLLDFEDELSPRSAHGRDNRNLIWSPDRSLSLFSVSTQLYFVRLAFDVATDVYAATSTLTSLSTPFTDTSIMLRAWTFDSQGFVVAVFYNFQANPIYFYRLSTETMQWTKLFEKTDTFAEVGDIAIETEHGDGQYDLFVYGEATDSHKSKTVWRVGKFGSPITAIQFATPDNGRIDDSRGVGTAPRSMLYDADNDILLLASLDYLYCVPPRLFPDTFEFKSVGRIQRVLDDYVQEPYQLAHDKPNGHLYIATSDSREERALLRVDDGREAFDKPWVDAVVRVTRDVRVTGVAVHSRTNEAFFSDYERLECQHQVGDGGYLSCPDCLAQGEWCYAYKRPWIPTLLRSHCSNKYQAGIGNAFNAFPADQFRPDEVCDRCRDVRPSDQGRCTISGGVRMQTAMDDRTPPAMCGRFSSGLLAPRMFYDEGCLAELEKESEACKRAAANFECRKACPTCVFPTHTGTTESYEVLCKRQCDLVYDACPLLAAKSAFVGNCVDLLFTNNRCLPHNNDCRDGYEVQAAVSLDTLLFEHPPIDGYGAPRAYSYPFGAPPSPASPPPPPPPPPPAVTYPPDYTGTTPLITTPETSVGDISRDTSSDGAVDVSSASLAEPGGGVDAVYVYVGVGGGLCLIFLCIVCVIVLFFLKRHREHIRSDAGEQEMHGVSHNRRLRSSASRTSLRSSARVSYTRTSSGSNLARSTDRRRRGSSVTRRRAPSLTASSRRRGNTNAQAPTFMPASSPTPSTQLCSPMIQQQRSATTATYNASPPPFTPVALVTPPRADTVAGVRSRPLPSPNVALPPPLGSTQSNGAQHRPAQATPPIPPRDTKSPPPPRPLGPPPPIKAAPTPAAKSPSFL